MNVQSKHVDRLRSQRGEGFLCLLLESEAETYEVDGSHLQLDHRVMTVSLSLSFILLYVMEL